MPKTLLLADDSITIQKVVGITFATEDFKITAVDNGEDALRKARELKPDVILADVVMPRKNGYELCEAVKSDPELQHIPVLLLAGTFEAFDENRARSARADGHIAKPFDSQVLANKVKELVHLPVVPGPQPLVATMSVAPAAAPRPAAPAPARPAQPAAPAAAARTGVAAPPRPGVPARPPGPGPVPPSGAPRPGAAAPPPGWRPGAAPPPGARPPGAMPPGMGPRPPGATPAPQRPAMPGARPAPRPPGAMPPPGVRPAPGMAPGRAAPPPSTRGPAPAPFPPRPTPAVRPAAPEPAARPAAPAAAPGAPAARRPPSEVKLMSDPFSVEPLSSAPPPPPPPAAAPPVSLEDDWSDLNLGGSLAAEPTTSRMQPALEPIPPPPPPVVAQPTSGLAAAVEESLPEAELAKPVAPEPLDLSLIEEGEAGKPIELAPASEFTPPAELTGHKPEPAAPVEARPADGGEAQLREALSKASREVVERIAWEVVPQLAETIIREHLDRLVKERQGQ